MNKLFRILFRLPWKPRKYTLQEANKLRKTNHRKFIRVCRKRGIDPRLPFATYRLVTGKEWKGVQSATRHREHSGGG